MGQTESFSGGVVSDDFKKQLMGYGLTRFEAPNSPFDCANYWGENHYGGGWNSRLPLAMPPRASSRRASRPALSRSRAREDR